MVMPKKVNPIERRKLFAEAAISVIAEKGLENLRLVDIAREAGLTTGSLTHYFNDKDQVVAAALDHVIETALAQANSTEDGLIPALLAFLPLDRDGHAAARVWLAFFSQSIGRPSLSCMHRQYYEEFVEALVRILSSIPALKSHTPDALTMTANLLIALVDGILVRATLDPQGWPPARQVEHLTWGVNALTNATTHLEVSAQ